MTDDGYAVTSNCGRKTLETGRNTGSNYRSLSVWIWMSINMLVSQNGYAQEELLLSRKAIVYELSG